MSQITEAPIFDADTHMYETAEAVTKFLPKKFQRSLQFVQMANAPASRSTTRSLNSSPTRPSSGLLPLVHTRSFYAGTNTEGLTLREMSTDVIEAPMGSRNPRTRSRNWIARA